MTTVAKLLSLCLSVSLTLTGPVAVLAQAPAIPAASSDDDTSHQGAYKTGAAVANVFVAPGRFIICTAGSLGAVTVMLLTFGTAYGTAKRVFEDGCVGKWTITAEDLRIENQRRGMTGGIADDAYLR
jgi:hypothetical protein